MMAQGQPPPLDAKQIQEFLGSMKKHMSQIDGEITTMKADAMGNLLNNVANLLNRIFTDKIEAEAKLTDAQNDLNEIYQGHPDIKVTMDAKKKDKKVAQPPADLAPPEPPMATVDKPKKNSKK